MLATKIILGGLEEYLPTKVKGSNKISSYFLSSALPTFALLFISSLFISIYIGNYIPVAIIVFSFSFYINGIVRTISPDKYDLMVNLPWLIFLPTVLLYRPTSGSELLIIHLLCHVCVTTVIIKMMPLKLFASNKLGDFNILLKLIRDSWTKSVSGTIYYFSFRSPVLILAVITGGLTDSMSITYSVAEAFWQISMVVINRRYAHALNKSLSNPPILIPIIFMLTASVMALLFDTFNVSVMLGMYIEFVNKIDFESLSVFIVYLLSLLLFIDLRYRYWGGHRSALKINIYLLIAVSIAWGISYTTHLFYAGVLFGAFLIFLLVSNYSFINTKR
ncbi:MULTISPECIES: hypothetical protein [Cobetia]|uniref:hypothetical protein n=1 Tax=Cobetia TaxID=204286 RepID=UPI00111560CC|nr:MULTISPECIES: hypothetical protein [Cobetia]